LLLSVENSQVTKVCTVRGCGTAHLARGLCNKHYLRWKNGGKEGAALLRYESHGMYQSVTYNTWRAMKSRCSREKDISYYKYGGRGIRVCDSWFSSFTAFLKDMGERPRGTTINRINNDGDYEPGNCEWATASKQTHNTRTRNDNRSGARGVFYRKDRDKWIAYINVSKDAKRKYLGSFESYEAALSAREEAEKLI
jgi:hypothetical protein